MASLLSSLHAVIPTKKQKLHHRKQLQENHAITTENITNKKKSKCTRTMTSHVDFLPPPNVEVEKPSKICKKTVKSRYALTDKDIAKLDYDEVPNPHYRSMMSMYLFDEDTVREFAHMKYGGEIGLEKILEKRAASSEKRRKSIASKHTNRKDELQQKLRDRKLTLRCDSKLCASYITRGTPSLDFVVEMMHEMNFYFTKTNYRKHYKKIVKVYKECESHYDPEEVSSSAKEDALSEWLEQFENAGDALQQQRSRLPPNIVEELEDRIQFPCIDEK